MAFKPVDISERPIVALPVEGPFVDMAKDHAAWEFLTDFFKDEDNGSIVEAGILPEKLNEWKEQKKLDMFKDTKVVGQDTLWRAGVIGALTLEDLDRCVERRLGKLKEEVRQTRRPGSISELSLWGKRQKVIKRAITLQPVA